MRKLVPALLGALVVTGFVYAIVSSMGGEYRLASMAPAHTTVWVEAQDFEQQVAAFKETEAFADFERSKTGEAFHEQWSKVQKMIEEGQVKALQDLGLEANEQTVHRFFGQNVGLGLIAPAEVAQGNPSAFAMTKVDVLGLAKDVLSSDKADWRKLWEKLSEVLGGEEAQKEEYQGFEILTRTDMGGELHMSMIEDVFVVSHDKDTVKEVIKVQVGETPSLADKSAFDDELSKLPASPAAYAWVDMDFVRDKERVTQTVHDLSGQLPGAKELSRFKGEVLDVLIEDLKPVSGLAMAVYVPEGDVYRAHLEGSHSGDTLFQENEDRDVRTLVSEETVAYMEVKGIYDLMVGFKNSEALAAILETDAAKWVRAKLEDPEQMNDLAQGEVPVEIDKDPTFELRLAMAVLAVPAQEYLGNDVAVAVEAHEADELHEAVRAIGFVRARPALRIYADVMMGAAQAYADEVDELEVSEYGGRKVYSLSEGPIGAHFSRLGAHFAVSSNKDMLQKAIDRAKAEDAGGLAQSEDFADTITRLPDGYHAFGFFNMARYSDLMKALMSGTVGPEQAERVTAGIAEQNDITTIAMAAYVDESFTSYTVRAYSSFTGEGRSHELYHNADDQPPAWKALPKGAMASAAWQTSPQGIYEQLLASIKLSMPEEQVDAVLERAKELLGGKDLESGLIAHLGQAMGFAVVSQDKLPPEGEVPEGEVPEGEVPEGEVPEEALAMMPAIPAAVAAVELKDAAAFEETFVTLVENGLLEAAKASKGGDYEWPVQMTLNNIQFAQQQYLFNQQDEQRYADSLKALVEEGGGMLEPELAGGEKDGFVYAVHVSESAPGERWMATAQPAGWPESGGRCYMVNFEGLVHYSDAGPFEANDACEAPAGAMEIGSGPPAPPLKVEIDPDDPEVFRLERREVDGTQIYAIGFPEREAERMQMQLGRGFTPGFAFVDGWMFAATSESALMRAIAAKQGGDSLAGDERFEAARGDHPTEVAMFGHLDHRGVIDQVDANGELIASQAAPAPDSLKAPEEPQYPEDLDPEKFEEAMDDYNKAMESYWDERMKHREKVQAWRKEHAKENAAEMSRLLKSLDVLGHVVTWYVMDEDDLGMEQTMVWELELDAAAAAASE